MDRAEHIMIQTSITPEEFIMAYNIKDKVHNIYIFAKITKGIYGELHIPEVDFVLLFDKKNMSPNDDR